MTDTPRFGPPDAVGAPRFTGVRTFARCPNARTTDDVDVAVVGIPFDTATSFRPGARFGPEAIRSGSALLRPYNPAQDVDVFASLSVVDWGDLDTTPGNAGRTLEQIAEGVGEILDGDVVPVALGGDHLIALGELRAHAARHGPVAVVLLDAHADTWNEYYGERHFHGTVFRRAAEEGLIAPERSVIAGVRGPLYAAADLDAARNLGFTLLTCDELVSRGPAEYAQLVKDCIGEGPAFLSFDIDVLDPAHAPATGTPEVGGLTAREALAFVRALAGIEFCGFDLVEVSPPYDGPGQTTAMLAANIAYELLGLVARRKSEREGESAL